MNARHAVEDGCRTLDRVRAYVMDRSLAEGFALVDDLLACVKPSEVLEDLLPGPHASSHDHRSFEC